ncbi:Dabb family protein [Scrofimicrobium sp. R131]|uniref:Dabb family protein n=1 Tax=Scrofimicrobium appendicitidis TaxID=3079930 RepID=A0AAU7VA21_9ACTO
MGLRHVVMWELNADDRAETAKELAAELRGLAGRVPGVESLSATVNTEAIEGNWDLVLDVTFTDRAALDAYQVHPDHQAVAAKIRAAASRRAAIDGLV